MARKTVGTAPFQFSVPDGLEPFDVPADLERLAEQASVLLAQAGVSDAAFQALLDRFIVAKAHRIDSAVSTVALTNADPTDYSLGLTVATPPWPSVAIINTYVNLDGVTTAGDLLVSLHSGGSVIAYNEVPVSLSMSGDMFQFTTIQNVPASATIVGRVKRSGLTGARVGTRYIQVVFLRLSTQVSRLTDTL